MYTRNQLANMFEAPHADDGSRYLTDAQLDTLEAIQAAAKDHGEQGFYPDGDFSSDADWCYGVGDLINRLEAELEIDDGSIFELYQEIHSENFEDGTINPEDCDEPNTYDFQFGAYGETKCSVHARSFDRALELAADWLDEHAPGHLIKHDDKEFWDDARKEAAKDMGYDAVPESEWTDEMIQNVDEQSTIDLTYTEAGYLMSWEWFVTER